MFGIKLWNKKNELDSVSGLAINKVSFGSDIARADLQKAVELANGGFHSTYSVGFSDVEEWIAKDSECILVGFDNEDGVAAYASVFTVSRETYRGLIAGEICDWDMSEIGPETMRASTSDAYFYVGAVVVREDLRGKDAFKTMRSAIVAHLNKVADGRTINVCCEIMSDKAKAAAEKMGLTKTTDALDGFPLYSGKL